MKLILLMLVCVSVAVASKILNPSSTYEQDVVVQDVQGRNWIIDQTVNALIRRLIEFIRRLINNGSDVFGIPVLDPLQIGDAHLSVPAGLINLELALEKILATGLGGFVVHRSWLTLQDLSFDLDVSVPVIDVSAEHYDFIGDLLNAIPLYGTGTAEFKVEGLRFRGKIFLKQSDDGKAVIIDRIEDISFAIPLFKSHLTGAIGGGDIDAIVNAIIQDVVIDYVNRFQGYISALVATLLPAALNPTLEQLDTWKYLAPIVPRP